MIDLHLINLTLAILGIGATAVVLIAAAVIATAAVRRRRAAPRHTQPVTAPAGGPALAASPRTTGRPEPALR